jgi:cadmium resistance transport/sequestration family protein
MNWVLQAIVTGITAFIATNIDDLVIMVIFFAQGYEDVSQSNTAFRPQHVILGKYLGFTLLILASFPGFLGGLIVPRPWIGLLGILPIAIGIYHLVQPDEDEQIQTVAPDELKLPELDRSLLSRLARSFNPQTYTVAAVTVANGGDNIGIYVPLFASSTVQRLTVILGIFYGLVGVWCYLAYRLTRQPTIARLLARYGRRLVPIVLIGLGMLILAESGSYQLLPFFGLAISISPTLNVYLSL